MFGRYPVYSSPVTEPADQAAVLVEVADRVAILTLNRPDSLNAFSGDMGTLLTDALRDCDQCEDVRAVIITGAGRAFCAGADFSKGAAVFDGPSDGSSFTSDPLEAFSPWRVRKPVIAAINGAAVGLGLTMALQCDIRIVADDAKLGIVQNRRGVMPDALSHWTLPRLVGHARAADLLLTGRMFRGTDALEWGMATEAIPAEDVLARAVDLARDIAVNTAPVSVGVSKRLLWRSAPTAEEITVLERELHRHLLGRADAKEGVLAFTERRDPQWTLTLARDWPDWLDDIDSDEG